MLTLLKYYAYSFLRPELKDFVDRGFGLEARQRRAARFWQPHLELSRAFQHRCLERLAPGGSAAVLGAGRLFDIDTDLLTRKFDRIELCDADISALPTWKRLARREPEKDFGFFVQDLTGTIGSWKSALVKLLRTSPQDAGRLCAFLNDLKAPLPRFGRPGGRAILSVNLLSQIPLFWRDRVHRCLRRYWQIEPADLPEEAQTALQASLRQLAGRHLEALGRSQAEVMVLISDTDFFYYTTQESSWEWEPALPIEQIAVPGYRIFDQAAWLWHIAPQAVEGGKHGVIHKVAAMGLRPDDLKEQQAQARAPATL